MELYKVLLVDDEEEVCQAMIKKMDWEQLGFVISGYAQNGSEALDIAEELMPDVVMTDIKMPYMDGLTLCRKLKERYGNIKVIIFSGFDEFEYAREAIKYEAEEYILKPINSGELKEVFLRIRNIIDKELDEKKNIDKLKEYYNKSLPIMQEHFYVGLLEGSIAKEQIKNYLASYQIGDWKADSRFLVAVISFEESRLDRELTLLSLKKLIDSELEKEITYRSIHYLDKIVLVVILEENSSLSNYRSALERIVQMSRRILDLNIIIGVGSLCDSPSQISHSYAGAKEALDYKVIYTDSPIIDITETTPDAEEGFYFPEKELEQIIREIKVGEKEDLQRAIHFLMKELKDSRISIRHLRAIVMTFITGLYKVGMNYGISMEEVFGVKDIYEKVLNFQSLDILCQWMMEVGLTLRGNIRKERVDSAKLLTDKAIGYINDHYGEEDLSIDSICAYLNVSSAYFSTIFKKETEKTFVNYLTHLRMEHATRLLNTTEDKTYVIAEKVGYSDPNYFSYVFKKRYGISPSKYRTNI